MENDSKISPQVLFRLLLLPFDLVRYFGLEICHPDLAIKLAMTCKKLYSDIGLKLLSFHLGDVENSKDESLVMKTINLDSRFLFTTLCKRNRHLVIKCRSFSFRHLRSFEDFEYLLNLWSSWAWEGGEYSKFPKSVHIQTTFSSAIQRGDRALVRSMFRHGYFFSSASIGFTNDREFTKELCDMYFERYPISGEKYHCLNTAFVEAAIRNHCVTLDYLMSLESVHFSFGKALKACIESDAENYPAMRRIMARMTIKQLKRCIRNWDPEDTNREKIGLVLHFIVERAEPAALTVEQNEFISTN